MGEGRYDAIVVGSGPNGLAAAVTLARARRSVLLIEAEQTVGGGCRSLELTLPGFLHDICSAIHPLGAASPCYRELPLAAHGLEWVFPPAEVAHPLDGGEVVLLRRSIDETAESLGVDAHAYRRLMAPIVDSWEGLQRDLLGPFSLLPGRPLALARFGFKAIRSAQSLATSAFRDAPARALFAGLAAHSVLPLERLSSAAIGLVLGCVGHVVGWPFPRGGAQQIADALARYFSSLGGEIRTGWRIESLDELPPSTVVLLDLVPRQLLQIAGKRLPPGYRRRLQRFRHGPGVFKLDYALDGPIPWAARESLQAATVHLGGTLEEICDAERRVWSGEHPAKPFVLLAQQSLFDDSRAPPQRHTAWAYCHVPNGSSVDMTGAIETQIERFAPGFRERVLERSKRTAVEMERYNPNYVGGDISGGVTDLAQLWTRPVARWVPYSTPARGIYLCSSSTPPGGGVHGMCGYHAARAALRRELRA
jgi:phytoene dehydrogenase-like protein